MASPAPRRFTPVASVKRPVEAKKVAHPRDKTGGESRRQAGKLTVTRALNEDEGARARSLAALKRAREKEKRAHFAGKSQPREKQSRDVIVPEGITVQELANRMSERAVDVIRLLMKQGEIHKITDVIDSDSAQIIAEEMGHTVRRVAG